MFSIYFQSPPTNHTAATNSSIYQGQQAARSTYSGYESAQSANGTFAGSYDSNLFASQTGGQFDIGNSAFNTADLNQDGSIDRDEFRQFLAANAQSVS